MTAKKIADRIAEMCTLFGFEYGGKDGNVDPYFLPPDKASFLLYFDGEYAGHRRKITKRAVRSD